MEDKKLRELSKEFLRNNVVSHSINLEGKIMHKFKNGRIRRIDLFKRFVPELKPDAENSTEKEESQPEKE